MADPTADPDTGVGPDPAAPGTPRWVKVSGAIALVLAMLVAAMLLIGGGNHGPGRHAPSGGSDGDAPPAAGYEPPADGHMPPADGHAP